MIMQKLLKKPGLSFTGDLSIISTTYVGNAMARLSKDESGSGRNEALASDLVVATLQKVYERAATFNSAGLTDAEQVNPVSRLG